MGSGVIGSGEAMPTRLGLLLAGFLILLLAGCQDIDLQEIPLDLSAQQSFQWEIRKDADGKEDSIPMVFRVQRTDPGSAANNVHQVELRFRPNSVQAGGGQAAGGLYFQFYVPNADYSSYETVTISNPPMADDGNDAAFDWAQDQGAANGYQIAMEKIDGAEEWLIEIRFKPYTGNPNLYGVVGCGSHTAAEVQFVVVGKNVTLGDPPAGELLSRVNMELGTRTRAQYNSSAALGTTGLTFDPPPQVTITTPVLPATGVKEYVVAVGASTPYVDDETFTASIANDDTALGGHRWVHDPPDDPTPTAAVPHPIADPLANTTIEQQLDFEHLGLHLVWFEVQETIFGLLTQTGRAYAFPVVKHPPSVTIASDPLVGEVPLAISLSVVDLQHNDPSSSRTPMPTAATTPTNGRSRRRGWPPEPLFPPPA